MSDHRTRRRDFVKALALAGGVASAPGAAVARPDDEPKPDPKSEPKSEVDARMELILARYGEKLDDEARAAVRRDVEGVVRRGEALRAFKLDNGDAPFPVFRPYREPLGAPGVDHDRR